MKELKCDFCSKEIKGEKLCSIEFAIWDLTDSFEKDSTDRTDEEFDLCKECYNKFLRSMRKNLAKNKAKNH